MAKKVTEKKTEAEVRPEAKPRKRTASASPKSSATPVPTATTRHRKATKRAVEPKMPTEAEIAELAYLIYEARCFGSPEGDWAVAEGYLKAKAI